MTHREYTNQKEKIIARFRKEFIEGYYLNDPLLHSIVEMLIRGADPYVIIEELIKKDNGALYGAGKENQY